MSLADFQNALAAMVMDVSFAQAVREDATRALAAFDLDRRERERLAGIASQPGLRIGTFFHHNFRMTKIAYTLPRTKEKLGEKLGAVLMLYWDEYPNVHEYFDREARRFAAWLLERSASEDLKRGVREELAVLELAL
ncbi:MAG: hypothetical protein NTW28_18465, partial [Candidatus Solibacter sp.]|nr:hypothetical protein [Candidatus Solibacter sp.]